MDSSASRSPKPAPSAWQGTGCGGSWQGAQSDARSAKREAQPSRRKMFVAGVSQNSERPRKMGFCFLVSLEFLKGDPRVEKPSLTPVFLVFVCFCFCWFGTPKTIMCGIPLFQPQKPTIMSVFSSVLLVSMIGIPKGKSSSKPVPSISMI